MATSENNLKSYNSYGNSTDKIPNVGIQTNGMSYNINRYSTNSTISHRSSNYNNQSNHSNNDNEYYYNRNESGENNWQYNGTSNERYNNNEGHNNNLQIGNLTNNQGTQEYNHPFEKNNLNTIIHNKKDMIQKLTELTKLEINKDFKNNISKQINHGKEIYDCLFHIFQRINAIECTNKNKFDLKKRIYKTYLIYGLNHNRNNFDVKCLYLYLKNRKGINEKSNFIVKNVNKIVNKNKLQKKIIKSQNAINLNNENQFNLYNNRAIS